MTEIIESCGNVFKDLGFDDSEAENLKTRSTLMIELKRTIQEKNLTQADAAKWMGVHQSLISDLVRGKINRFTVDKLINMAAKAGLKVVINIEKVA